MPLKAVKHLLTMLSSSSPSLSSPSINQTINADLTTEYEEYDSDADADSIKSSLNEFLANVETFGFFATSGKLPGDVIIGYLYAISGGSLSHSSKIKRRKS